MSGLRVGTWGIFGRGNFGNEAALEAFLNRLDPAEFEPVIICEQPAAAAALHGVNARILGTPAISVARGQLRRAAGLATNRLALLRNAFRVVGDLDAVVLVGSGGLERYGTGAFGTPFDMWALTVAGVVLRRPVLLLNVGIEVLPRRLARAFARGVARGSSYRSYRDSLSRSGAEEMKLHGATTDPVVTDLALRLPQPPRADRDADLVIVGVMDYRGRYDRGGHAAAQYLAALEALVRALRSAGKRVHLVGGDVVDLKPAHELAERLADPEVTVLEAQTPQELIGAMQQASVAIATRYHTLIMALLGGTPALSIGYGEKHRAMLQQLELPELHFDIEEFDPALVAAEAERLARQQPALTPQIEFAVEVARARLDAQWPVVKRVLASRGATS